jgi:hypothetical protein
MIKYIISAGLLMATISSIIGCTKNSDDISKEMVATSSNIEPAKAVAAKKIEPITIQNLSPEDAPGGAGAYFSLASEDEKSNNVIFTYSTDKDEPVIKISDRLMKLKFIKRDVLEKGKGTHSIGEHVIEQWGNSETTASFDFRTVSGGEAGVRYKGKLTVQMNGEISSIEIVGGFGD